MYDVSWGEDPAEISQDTNDLITNNQLPQIKVCSLASPAAEEGPIAQFWIIGSEWH